MKKIILATGNPGKVRELSAMLNGHYGVVSQKDSSVSDPKISDINKIGTVAKILRVLQMPDGNITVIIQGKKRFELKDIISDDPYFTATINEIPESKPDSTDEKFIATIP